MPLHAPRTERRVACPEAILRCDFFLTLFVLAAFSALFAQSPTAPMHAVSTESAASGGCFSANVFLLEGTSVEGGTFSMDLLAGGNDYSVEGMH